MVLRDPLLTILLLVCGFSSAPLGSMVQAPADATASVSVPRPGSGQASGSLVAPVPGGRDFPGAFDTGATPPVSPSLHLLPPRLPAWSCERTANFGSPIQAGRFTYRSNAPPAEA